MSSLPLVYAPTVEAAKKNGRPIVALESTIITHGMPYPQNLKMVRQVESIIRSYGVEPATIAILEGVIHIGLTDTELEALAHHSPVQKVSTRDIAWVTSQRLWGATTVAATMRLAHKAGLSVFVTGGIGGVHQNAAETFDISADLTELAQTPVAVICAGAKSILDLPLTLEYLETHAIPILGYQTDVLPGFYTRKTALPLEHTVHNPNEIAAFLDHHWQLSHSGVVIANPIPEEYALPESTLTTILMEAHQEAEREGISGKAITPFLLNKVLQLTQGQSLDANCALVYNNAHLGAQLALSWQTHKEKQ